MMSTHQWIEDGGSRRTLRASLARRELVRLKKGFFMTDLDASAPILHRRRVEAAAESIGPNTLFSHSSAGVIHGLPLLSGRLGAVEVIRMTGHGEVTETLHAYAADVDPADRGEIDGLPVTSLGRTVADLIRRLPFAEAVMVADAALARQVSREELRSRTATGRGCRLAARVLDFADERAESPGESLSRVRMKQDGLPRPDLQVDMQDASGRFLGRVDFLWRAYRLVGEFDGAVKYGELVPVGQTPATVIVAEKRRELALRNMGYQVVRWTWGDLWQPEFTQVLRRAMRAADTGATDVPRQENRPTPANAPSA